MRRFTRFALRTLTLSAVIGCGSSQPRTQAEPAPAAGKEITSADLQGGQSVENVLQKRYPGLEVKRGASGDIQVRVRGNSSYMEKETMPLYILNGSPYQPGPDGALSGISPDDILSIKLLRGAEASIYGIDGANGVIVITTKMGPAKR